MRTARRAGARLLMLAVAALADGTAAQPPDAAGASADPARGLRSPLMPRVRAPAVQADYVINLLSTRDPAEARAAAASGRIEGLRLYISSIEVDGAEWHRVRLGFFASEEEAADTLGRLAARFPRAWIGRAEPQEVRDAESGSAHGATGGESPPGTPTPAVAAAAVPSAGVPLDAAALEALESAGREALLGQDHAAAIAAYTALLRSPGEHRADARERLGLAYERSGDLAQASAQYRTYLEQYPDGEGARRVRQRLNGLTAASAPPRTPLREHVSPAPRWQIESGISQYYRRDAQQLEGRPEVVGLSGLFSDLDLRLGRSGDAVDLGGRVTVSHLHDLAADAIREPLDQTRVSYAYFDAGGTSGLWSLRLGRQRLSGMGVLGRFDGAHFEHAAGARRRVHVLSGYPVESTRDGIERQRRFTGAALELEELIGAWTLTAFATSQTIGGVEDRRAIGVESRYLDARRSITTMLDYDTGFGEVNTALAFGTWRLDNRITLTGLVDLRLSPVLTVRNALLGQAATSIEELLLEWREEDLEQLARDRTMQTRTVTLGIAKPLFERLQLNADVTVSDLEPIDGSSPPAIVPVGGRQTYYSASLIASALFGTGDVSIFNVRHGSGEDFSSSQLTWDARFPVGRRLRLNPRLRLTAWEHRDGRQRQTVSPSLRLLLNARRYRLELEAGTSETSRTDKAGEVRSSGDFLNFGYRVDF